MWLSEAAQASLIQTVITIAAINPTHPLTKNFTYGFGHLIRTPGQRRVIIINFMKWACNLEEFRV